MAPPELTQLYRVLPWDVLTDAQRFYRSRVVSLIGVLIESLVGLSVSIPWKKILIQAWWYMPVIPALGKLGQEDYEFRLHNEILSQTKTKAKPGTKTVAEEGKKICKARNI
jgi:hypothetical protein